MKFDSPKDLGTWAEQNNVERVAFYPDGSLRSVVFSMRLPAGLDGDEPAPEAPRRKAVNKAINFLKTGSFPEDGK